MGSIEREFGLSAIEQGNSNGSREHAQAFGVANLKLRCLPSRSLAPLTQGEGPPSLHSGVATYALAALRAKAGAGSRIRTDDLLMQVMRAPSCVSKRLRAVPF